MNKNCNRISLHRYDIPRWILLQLLEKCNLRCKMCYEWGIDGAYHQKTELSQLSVSAIKKVIEDCSPVRPYYELFGGEPLLYQWIDEVLSAIKHYKSIVAIPTNGTLLEKYAEMLVDIGVDKVWISLDGPEEINDKQRGRGVYSKIMRGIDKLRDIRCSKGTNTPAISVQVIVTPMNYLFLDKLITECICTKVIDQINIDLQAFITQENLEDYSVVLRDMFSIHDVTHAKGLVCKTADFSSLNFSEMAKQFENANQLCKENGICLKTNPRQTSEEVLRKYFSGEWSAVYGERRKCIFPWISAEVSATGDVTSCHSFYDLSHGNINNESILEIWNNESYRKFRNYIRKNSLSVCQSCYLFHNQGGGV